MAEQRGRGRELTRDQVEARLAKLKELKEKGLVRSGSVERGRAKLESAVLTTDDGFQGSYVDILAREKSMRGRSRPLSTAEIQQRLGKLSDLHRKGLVTSESVHRGRRLLETSFVESDDGFRGSYAEYLVHEESKRREKYNDALREKVDVLNAIATEDVELEVEETKAPEEAPAKPPTSKSEDDLLENKNEEIDQTDTKRLAPRRTKSTAYSVYQGHAHSRPIDSKHKQDHGEHLSNLVPEKIDKATAKKLRGHLFDEVKFDQIKDEDGFISRRDANKGKVDTNEN